MSENSLPRGTLIRGLGSFYTVVDADGNEYTLRCKKKFRRMHMSPLVGDEVLFIPGTDEEDGWLEEILPRRSECIRPPVANVSLLLVTVCPEPQADLLLVDRLLIRARMQGIRTALVVTKADLDPTLCEALRKQYAGADTPVFGVCAMTGEGFDALRAYMRGHLCCMAGQSGVGKSTLLNALLGLSLETGEISEKIRRGKNTTRHAELLTRDGIRVLDTAGFSLLELDGKTDPVTLQGWYPEFAEFADGCRFSPCLHDREPGCAVTEAVQAGRIDPLRVERYRQLLQDVKEVWRNRYD